MSKTFFTAWNTLSPIAVPAELTAWYAKTIAPNGGAVNKRAKPAEAPTALPVFNELTTVSPVLIFSTKFFKTSMISN